jgi:Gpi18-like mannosyltransferase
VRGVEEAGPERATVLRGIRTEATWQQWALVAVALLCALGMRYALAPNVSGDVAHAVGPWLDDIRKGGFSALAGSFSNYNPPYLYLLFLGSLTPLSDVAVVKTIAAVFDLVLAAGVAAIAFRLRGGVFVAAGAGVAALLLPEVFLNSAMWGQADGVFAAFLVWSAWALLTKRFTLAWVLFALAFSVKLQAMFLLPWIALAFIVQRHRWRSVLVAAGALLLAYVPALLAGRSIPSLADIYLDQVGAKKLLAVGVANMYQWVPAKFYSTVFPAALFFAVAVVALLAALYLRRMPRPELTGPWVLRVAAAFGVLVPFVLPAMHDRYFYVGGLFTALCVLVDRRYLGPAIVLQFTAVMAYAPFLWGVTVIPYWATAIPQLGAVLWVVWLSLSPIFASGAQPELRDARA